MKLIDPDAVACPLFVMSEPYAAFDGPWHAHRRAQFIYAADGVLTIRTTNGMWVVPPQRAVWIMPGEKHKGSAPRAFRLKTLYVEPGLPVVPDTGCVVSVDRVLDALLSEASTFGPSYPDTGPEQRLMQVVMDRLTRLKEIPAFLPSALDPRLVSLTMTLERDPTDNRPLDALAAECGMTARTASRLFVRDTGLTFAQWRQQMRLLKAMQSMSLGRSVTHAAMEVGYSDVSAFISVFKDSFGDTPARYFRQI